MPVKKQLSVAIIVDPAGSMDSTPEDEIEEHKKRFSLILSDFDLQFSTPKFIKPDMVADLVLYDFGGMAGAYSLMQDNSRAVIQWAVDHPSALVLVVSSYTFGAYVRPELMALGLSEIRNVIQDDYDETVPAWFLEGR